MRVTDPITTVVGAATGWAEQMPTAPLHLLDPVARPVVDGYLDALASRLPCGATTRNAIVAEIGDGLVDAVHAHLAAGLAPVAAARAATAEFGDPRRLAAEFAHGLVASAAMRTGIMLVASGPVVGALWLAAFAGRSGTGWFEQLRVVWSAIPAYPLILAVTVPAAVLAVAAGSSRLPARVPVSARGAAIAALVATGGCVAGDTTLLTGLTLSARSGWTTLAWMACAVSVARLCAAATAGRRCARLRAAASA